MQRTLLVLGLGGIVVGSFAIWLLLSQVMRPLQSLRCGAEAVGRGDFSRRVPVTGTDECGQLAEAFNRMTGNLELSRAQLERAHESLKSTQDQLIQREKLSAVGEFVAGVTHELNNPLAVIIGYAQLLQMESLNPEQEAYVRQIVGGVHRCRKITRSLLAFARQHPPERLDVDVNALLDETLGFIQYELRTGNIEVVRRLAPGLPPVHADPHQLQQVFLNIANNARQAMEEHAGRGRLVVTTEEAGPRVRITLQDDGPGISAENLGRLFTPFFTTKAVGKGTGLGMSVSYGIIQEHGGDIRAESRPGAGATFVIELPSGTGQAAVVTRPLETEAVPVLEAAGRSVLVVDDEEPLLELYRDALSRRGFRVEMAGDGEAALRRLEESRFDLVLCDMKMPGLNGQETYERLLARDRDAASRFIFITGDTLNERTRAFVQAQRRACLSKPFSLDEFYDAVRQVAEAG